MESGKGKIEPSTEVNVRSRRIYPIGAPRGLLPPIAALDAPREPCEDLVGDGVAGLGKSGERTLFAPEDQDGITRAGFGDVGDVDHAGIHADIADRRAEMAVYQHRVSPTAEPAGEAVSIADRDDGDA